MKFEAVGAMLGTLKLFGPFTLVAVGFINDIFVFFLSYNSYIVSVGEECQCITILPSMFACNCVCVVFL